MNGNQSCIFKIRSLYGLNFFPENCLIQPYEYQVVSNTLF
jgi:hypothetical protein